MAAFPDTAAPRLYLDLPLAPGARLALDRGQANYLLSVLRLRAGDPVLAFNGRDGEWRAAVAPQGRRSAALLAEEQVRPQPPMPDLLYLFAPLKHARLDYMVQKAVEMGAGALRPVFTRHTQSTRVNLDRMRANVIEAAEQCGILALPEVLPEADLAQALNALEADRLLVFCDEEAPVSNPANLLRERQERGSNNKAGIAVLVGPEGGFTAEERQRVAAHGNCVRVSLGPRILRADTAAVAALAVVQATLGDWR